MYLLGTSLTAYFDWWLRRTATFPRRWEAGSVVLAIVVSFSAIILPIYFWLALFVITLLVAVPAHFAASRHSKRQRNEEYAAYLSAKRTKSLIKRGLKK